MALRVGLRKTSLVDYPGRIAAALFFPACNLRCPWCHNRELVGATVTVDTEGLVDLDEAFRLIEERRGILGGVVLSGGEPTLRHELPAVVERCKRLGLAVKIDTNGTLPSALERLFSNEETRPDYVALDLKIAPHRYSSILGPASDRAADRSGEDIEVALRQSAELLASSGISHEFRTLALGEDAFTEADIAALSPLVDDNPWYFAPFRPGNCLDDSWNARPPTGADDAARLAAAARALGKKGEVRAR